MVAKATALSKSFVNYPAVNHYSDGIVGQTGRIAILITSNVENESVFSNQATESVKVLVKKYEIVYLII